MRYFPLFLRLQKRKVLIVGGGKVAARKVDLLLEVDAELVVVAPEATALLRQYHAAGQIEWRQRRFEPADVDGAWLVIAALTDPAVRDEVLRIAHARNLAVNVVDEVALSDAIVPAIVDRSPLQIAISSGGAAPVYARRVREMLEALLSPGAGKVAAFLQRYRHAIRHRIGSLSRRRRFYEWLIDGPVGASVLAGREGQARRQLLCSLAARTNGRKGLVSLVGAGPGDPDLLTLKALRRLQQADVILHDGLVDARVLALARRDAEKISVAKRAYGMSAAQAEIHRLLRDHSLRGRNVVRLKGGDPLVFGRGGEEIAYLCEWKIPFEVVPGITAAVACAAYAGIPLTQRGEADAVSLATAHRVEARDRGDWAELADSRHTLALYMGVGKVAQMERELLAHGRSPDTPVAFVENGTRAHQRVLVGTLQGMSAFATNNQLASPAMVFIGPTAAYAKTQGWFGAPPVQMSGRSSTATVQAKTGEIAQ